MKNLKYLFINLILLKTLSTNVSAADDPGGGGGGGGNSGSFSDIYHQINSDAVGLKPDLTNDPNNSIINIIEAVLPYLFVIAGLILLIMLIHAGFVYLTSTTNPDKTEEAKKKITLSLTGFFIIFASYWIAQALQVMLGIPILGGR